MQIAVTLIENATPDVTHLFTIPQDNLALFNEKIAGLNKRAAKVGLPPLTVVERGTEERPVRQGSKLMRTWHKLAVTTVADIKLNGWKLLGVLGYLPGSDAPIIREVPGETVPESYRTGDRSCAYCGKARERRETFIVQHENGETKRIGRNCLRDFLGVDPKQMLSSSEWLASLSSLGDDDYSGGGSRQPTTFEPSFVMPIAIRVIDKKGYWSKSAIETIAMNRPDGGKLPVATANEVTTYIAALNGWLPKVPVNINQEVLDEFGDVTDEDVRKGTAVLDWAKGMTGNSTYAYNLRTAASAQQITGRELALLVSAYGAWKKATTDDVAKEKAVKVPSEFMGTEGQKGLVVDQATVLFTRTLNGEYGPTTLITFKTPEGNLLKWFASGALENDFPVGGTFALRGTVKKHETYNGDKQTVLTRVKATPVA